MVKRNINTKDERTKMPQKNNNAYESPKISWEITDEDNKEILKESNKPIDENDTSAYEYKDYMGSFAERLQRNHEVVFHNIKDKEDEELQDAMKPLSDEQVNNLLRNINDTKNFDDVIKILRTTYINKNKDYGSSFDKTFETFGVVSLLTRLSDKMNRLTSLYLNGKACVTDESFKDTLLDMANYAILGYIKLHNNE